MILKIPIDFFRAIRKENSKTQILWMRWLAFGEELKSPDILRRIIIDTPKLPAQEIKEIYDWGIKILEDSPLFKSNMDNTPEISDIKKEIQVLKGRFDAMESEFESLKSKNKPKNTKNESYPDNIDQIKDILDYLNLKANTNYSINSAKNKEHISARLKEGYSVEVLKEVIDKKVKEWAGTQMEKYIRPMTLFNSAKFESYVNQKSDQIIDKKSINNLSDAVNKAKELY
jgi:hypothetical protein